MPNDIKHLREFSVGGNIYEDTCWLSLYNEDIEGNEYDTVYIELDRKQIRSLIKVLEMHLKPDAK